MVCVSFANVSSKTIHTCFALRILHFAFCILHITNQIHIFRTHTDTHSHMLIMIFARMLNHRTCNKLLKLWTLNKNMVTINALQPPNWNWNSLTTAWLELRNWKCYHGAVNRFASKLIISPIEIIKFQSNSFKTR